MRYGNKDKRGLANKRMLSGIVVFGRPPTLSFCLGKRITKHQYEYSLL